MKKRTVFLTVGMAAMLAFTSGCSKTDSQAQTTAVQESQSAQEESQTEASAETKTLETEAVELGEAPIKIWGTITEIGDSTMTVDNQSENSSTGEIVFNIDPENTVIIDSVTGLPVELPLVQLGAFEAYLGPVMTMSIPPQMTPEVIIVNISEDAAPAQYVTATGPLKDTDGGKILTCLDGTEYTLADSVEISPFLTRNIVVLEDIVAASRCLIWQDADGKVESIVLFAQ